MAMSGSELKGKFVQTIFNGLKREFAEEYRVTGYPPVLEEHWMKMARAIADIAVDAVTHIQDKGEVQDGIQVSTTGPIDPHHSGETVSKGKIK